MLRFEAVDVELYDALSALHHRALAEVTLSVDEGEGVALLGPNGAGKSTMLLAAAGVLPVRRGEIRIAGQRLTGTSRARRRVQRLMGVALQFPERGFFATTVAAEVAFTCRRVGLDEAQRQEAVAEAIERVGLPPNVQTRSPHELSGGEKRLVALAAAVAHRPKLLLLDEPEAGLDLRGGRRVSRLIRRFTREGGGALVVTHDLESALAWADRLVILDGGRVVSDVRVDELTSGDRWDVVGAWLWDRGALGRACAQAGGRGSEFPSPYVEPEACIQRVRSHVRLNG